MFNLFQSKPVVQDSSSLQSDFCDYEPNTYESEPICLIQSHSNIVSNVSGGGAKLTFSRGSFEFSRTDENSIVLQFHPIFLWRLILFNETKKNDEEIVDFTRLRAFVSRFMKKRCVDICFNISEYDIKYVIDELTVVKPISKNIYDKQLELFYKLHVSLTRNYDSIEIVDAMLNDSFIIIRIISGI